MSGRHRAPDQGLSPEDGETIALVGALILSLGMLAFLVAYAL